MPHPGWMKRSIAERYRALFPRISIFIFVLSRLSVQDFTAIIFLLEFYFAVSARDVTKRIYSLFGEFNN